MSNPVYYYRYPYPTYESQMLRSLAKSDGESSEPNGLYTPQSEENHDQKQNSQVPEAKGAAKSFSPKALKTKFMNLINSKEKTSYKVHKSKEKKSKLHYRNYTPPETSDDRYTSCDSRRSKHKSKKQHKPERHDKQKTEKHDKHSGRESSKRKAHRVSDDESFTPPPKRREPEIKKLDRSPTRKYIDPPAKLVAPEEPAKISETVAVSNAAFKGNVFLQLKSSGSNNIHSLSLISEIALTQPSGKIKLELEPTKKRHHIKKTAFPKPATLSVAPSLDTSLHGEPNFNYTLNVSNIPMPSDLAILHDLGQTTIGSRISTPKLCPSPGSSSIGSSSTKKSAGFAPFSLKSNTLPRLDGKPNNILLSVYTPKNLSDGELEDSPIKYPELVQHSTKGLKRGREQPSPILPIDIGIAPLEPFDFLKLMPKVLSSSTSVLDLVSEQDGKSLKQKVSNISMTNVSGTSSPSAPNILQRRPTYSHLNKMSEMPSLPPPSSDPPIVRKRPSAIEKRPNTFELDCHRSISSFALLEVVGEGTYGEVWKGLDTITKETVALKKLRMISESDGFPISAIRELKFLRQLQHPNIIHLRDIVPVSKRALDFKELFMVFDYIPFDLSGLIESGIINWNEAKINSIFVQIMRGVARCHEDDIMHRDIKCANILVTKQGVVKLADFGLSRVYDPVPIKSDDPFKAPMPRPYSKTVISLWYRPLELMLGLEAYDKSVDLWSCGCIFAELYKGNPLFPGASEHQMIHLITKLCGSPTVEDYPKVVELKHFHSIQKQMPRRRRLREEFVIIPFQAQNLLDSLLELNPARRITAAGALESACLKGANENLQLFEIPITKDYHEMDAAKKRRMK